MLRDADFYNFGWRLFEGNESFQEFVETMFAEKYNAPQTDGFRWDDQIQTDFNYKQIQAEFGLYAMASYVDLDSDGPYRSTSGFEVKTGSIPRFKHGFKMDEKIIREHMILMDDYGRFTPKMKEALLRLTFNSVDQLIGGNYNTLTHQRHQIVSKNEFSILDATNPQGIKNIKFTFEVPDKNKTVLAGNKRWWTDAELTVEGTESDPIKDMLAMVRDAEARFIPAGHFEIDKLSWEALAGHSKVLKVVGLLYNPLLSLGDGSALAVAKNMDEATIKTYIERKIKRPIKIIDSVVAVEKYNKEERKVDNVQVRPFDKFNIALVPDGELGTIKSVVPIAVADPAARYAYYDGGRTLLTTTFDAKKKSQYVQSELTALVVPNKANYLMTLTFYK